MTVSVSHTVDIRQCLLQHRPPITALLIRTFWAASEKNRDKNKNKWKKRSEETQTLRAGCSKAEPNIFASPQTPSRGRRTAKIIISWRWSLPLPTDPVWWGSMHAISSYHGNRPTNTQDRLQYTAPQLVRSLVNKNKT